MITPGWVAGLIDHHDMGKPRSQQEAVGPSELGDVCDRRLAYRALGLPKINRQREVLAAWIGTHAHVGMAEAVHHFDDGRGEWQTEVEAMIPGYNIPCHVDAWHEASGTVLDWKFVGESSLRKYSSQMLPQYRTQVHLYGLGISASLGKTVNTVGVVLIPRNGGMHKIHVWTEPYDESVAEAALRRWHSINVITERLGEKAVRAIEMSPRAWCEHCPFWNPSATEADPGHMGCPGYEARRAVVVPPEWPQGHKGREVVDVGGI